jgi:hypothetical protein
VLENTINLLAIKNAYLTAEICKQHWSSEEAGLEKADEQSSDHGLKQLLVAGAWWEAAVVSILVMLSQHSHHFCNCAICFQTQLQKSQKWWKYYELCGMQAMVKWGW